MIYFLGQILNPRMTCISGRTEYVEIMTLFQQGYQSVGLAYCVFVASLNIDTIMFQFQCHTSIIISVVE